MKMISTVGIDISKRVFQLHGPAADGAPVLKKKLTRGGFLPFLEGLPPCVHFRDLTGRRAFLTRTSLPAPA